MQQESDIAKIASVGLNHVRIPLGYWSVIPNQGDTYVQGAYQVLGNAVQWASNHGIKVMIDIHGAQGSQNGFDNSGHKGNIGFGQGNTYAQLRAVLQKVRDDYASNPAVSTIEIVNEPMASTIGEGTVEQLYRDSWGDLDQTDVYTTFHDGFLGVNYWDQKFDSGMDGMLTDTHHYEIFDNGQLAMSPADHNKAACAFGAQMASNSRPTIAGEFSGALTDCAQSLNGRGVGARYDGSYQVGSSGSSYIGDCARKTSGKTADLSADEKSNIAAFINAQLSAFEKKSGWIYWTWKTEGAPEWDMQDLLANGLFPNPVTSHANAC
ncbi:glycoside hydrolase family 5 protein, partial [Myriangium duriaei CBS 260.36]